MQLDEETAAWYLACAASVSYARYHKVGKQPIVEKQRLTEANEAVVSEGQLGEDDDLIQYQVISRAFHVVESNHASVF